MPVLLPDARDLTPSIWPPRGSASAGCGPCALACYL